MIVVSYDISNNSLRTRFSNFLKKFGYRIQYSVFNITNSERILQNVITEIEGNFSKKFTQSDSVIIFHFSKQCKTHKFGYAANEDKDIIFIS